MYCCSTSENTGYVMANPAYPVATPMPLKPVHISPFGRAPSGAVFGAEPEPLLPPLWLRQSNRHRSHCCHTGRRPTPPSVHPGDSRAWIRTDPLPAAQARADPRAAVPFLCLHGGHLQDRVTPGGAGVPFPSFCHGGMAPCHAMSTEPQTTEYYCFGEIAVLRVHQCRRAAATSTARRGGSMLSC
jgi:hypothetical protein